MDKKALEAIIEMAKAAGADVKVVEIKGNESEEGNEENLPTIPLLKFEVGLEKNDGELFARAISSNHQLGELFLQVMPFGIDINRVEEIFAPAFKMFKCCVDDLGEELKKSIEGAEKDEEERVADLESSIICMECKDHLDSDDYLQLGYLNQELAQCKKDLENGNYQL